MDDPTKVLDIGNTVLYPMNKPDLQSAFVDRDNPLTSPTGLGALMGIYYSVSKPFQQGDPISLNTIGLLIPQTPSSSAYTVDLPNLTSDMIKAQPVSALSLVVDNSK